MKRKFKNVKKTIKKKKTQPRIKNTFYYNKRIFRRFDMTYLIIFISVTILRRQTFLSDLYNLYKYNVL